MQENWLKRAHRWKIHVNTMLDYKAKEKVEIGLVKLIYKWINSN